MATNMENINNNITINNIISTFTKELDNLEEQQSMEEKDVKSLISLDKTDLEKEEQQIMEEKEAKYLISLLDKTNFRQKSLELDITDLKRQIVEEDDSDED